MQEPADGLVQACRFILKLIQKFFGGGLHTKLETLLGYFCGIYKSFKVKQS